MLIYPAIDLYEGKAVRLLRGDYGRMTVYSERPVEVARAFAAAGATHMHAVDLEGARSGTTPNLEVIREIVRESGLFVECGGGLRSAEAVEAVLSAGAGRAILGTAAVEDPQLLAAASREFGGRLAVGVDIRDGRVAVRGWTETSGLTARDFLSQIEALGIGTVICTDISRDGAMRGANTDLYRELSRDFGVDLIASGGVSSLENVRALRALGLHGAIVGKAYYTGAIDLREAIEVAA